MTATTTGARPTRDQVTELVLRAVAVVCQRPATEISADTSLEALEVDSLGRVCVAEIVEQDLASYRPGVRIPDDDLDRFTTPADAVDYLLARL